MRIADDFHRSIAAYKQFDVLLVNAVMDGLNLVAKEAPYVNARDGVVVLSVNAGAYEEIGAWTVPVDPLDVEGQADALEAALALPEEERRARLDAIRKHVRESRPLALDRRAAFRPRPRQYDAAAMSDLSHVDESGAVRMVDVGSKPMSAAPGRRARVGPDGAGDRAAPGRPAEGRRAHDRAARRDHGGEEDERPDPALPSAAALGRRRLAGVVADGVEITATAETTAQTGVEMEALVAASVAALTVYDMAKAIDKAMVVTDITLVEKTKEEV